MTTPVYPRAADDPGYWRFSPVLDVNKDAPHDVAFHAASAFDARELARKFLCRDVPNAWTLVDVGDACPDDCVAFNKVVGR